MPATRSGVYHNLKESKYVTSNKEVTLFFSSKYYLHKFLAEYPDNREKFRERMNKLISASDFNTDCLADMHLYKRIEKRGFRVKGKGVVLEWQDCQKYALAKMTRESSPDWHVIQKLNIGE